MNINVFSTQTKPVADQLPFDKNRRHFVVNSRIFSSAFGGEATFTSCCRIQPDHSLCILANDSHNLRRRAYRFAPFDNLLRRWARHRQASLALPETSAVASRKPCLITVWADGSMAAAAAASSQRMAAAYGGNGSSVAAMAAKAGEIKTDHILSTTLGKFSFNRSITANISNTSHSNSVGRGWNDLYRVASTSCLKARGGSNTGPARTIVANGARRSARSQITLSSS